jgi:hypothetical protein
MPRNSRPPVILVMAILNFVFGGLLLLCGLCGLAGYAAIIGLVAQPGGGANSMGDMTGFMDKEAPGWMAVEIGRGLLLILFGVLLVVAGMGLLKMQSWARWLCVVYAVAMLFLQVAYVTYEFAVVIPAGHRFQEQQWKKQGVANPPPSTASSQAGTAFGVATSAGLSIVHALAVGIVMLLPNVGEAFAPPRRRARERDEDDFYDDDDYDDRQDRRRRRPRAQEYRDDKDDTRFRRRPRGRDYDDYD